MPKTSKKEIDEFKAQLHGFYAKNRRDLPWRNTNDPYNILVSEVMLQQTQVSRVLIKYPAFINQFPEFSSLARADLARILPVWQGMGYNRRALYLKKTAEIIVQNYRGILPQDPKILETLPGIGIATAASIIVFSFNKPLAFIETNIRRVYIHHFFEARPLGSEAKVDDREILPLVEETMDRKNPREWFYALMDYGSFLSKEVVNPNRKSKQYVVQSKFEGSLRQVRGKILRDLVKHTKIKRSSFVKTENVLFSQALDQLQKEGFIEIKQDIVMLKK